jgi:hypothetical protein
MLTLFLSPIFGEIKMFEAAITPFIYLMCSEKIIKSNFISKLGLSLGIDTWIVLETRDGHIYEFIR